MNKKWYEISGWIFLCFGINWILRLWIEMLSLPLWGDCLGTALAAYMFGPVTGMIVAATSNIVCSLRNLSAFYYLIVNVLVGFIIGIYARKGYFENYFKVLTTISLITFLSTVISTILNVVLFEGKMGNVWGDGIFMMIYEYGIPLEISSFIATFFIEFLDKLITLLTLFSMIKFFRKMDKKIFRKKIFTSFLLFFLVIVSVSRGSVFAKETNSSSESIPDYSQYIQTVYSNNNGLISGEANDITTTEDGIIWIGTYAGLYRYSGNEMQYCDTLESVKNVNCLYVDMEGRLWIGTNDDGVSICIEEEIVNTLNEESNFPSNSIRSIVQSTNGDFFIGTSKELAVVSLTGGIHLINTYSNIQYAMDLTADQENHVVSQTSSGQLYLMDENQVYDNIVGENGLEYTCCEFGEDGNLYVGTNMEEIHVFDIKTNKFVLKKKLSVKNVDSINSINFLENGCIFICSEKEVGWLDGQDEYHHINVGDFNSSIDRMTVDYQGNLWFSSSRLGIMKLCPSLFTEMYPECDVKNQVVNTVQEWNGLLYSGTDSGLDILNIKENTSVQNELSEMVGDSRIRCLKVDSQNRLWICSYGKGVICATAPNDYTFFTNEDGLLGNKPRSLIEQQDGTFVISSELGLTMINKDEVIHTISTEDGLTNPLILCLLETNKNQILAGSDGGGISIIENGNVTSTLTRKDGLSSDVILRLVKDVSRNIVYIVTSNGICLLDEEGKIHTIDTFPYSNNYDILDIGTEQLYVTSSAGIYIVDKEALFENNIIDYENLNYLSGLRGTFTANAWNYVDDNQNIYIAGGEGITKFDLQKYQKQGQYSYRMLIKTVELDKTIHHVQEGETIQIDRDCELVTIKPEIINYSLFEPYVSYYLEGYDTNKTVVLQKDLQDISYAGLNSGTYRFHLSILDGPNGNILEEMIYTFEKEAEIYDYLWFKIYFVFETLLIIAWFTWFFTRKRIESKIELQRKEIEFAKEQVRLGNETILAIAKTVDAKDQNTSQHSARVSKYSVLIAERMGYDKEELEHVRKAALLHDIGKIGIPDRVLNKPDQLTDEEFTLMKSHVDFGGDILKHLTMIPHVQEGALYHHERYDGFGYNKKLKGKDIPEIARIIGIADAFDAMSANRVYRKRMPFQKVIEELKNGRGKQFDPDILDIFLELVEEGVINEKEIYGEA